jgi:hypothetical protein
MDHINVIRKPEERSPAANKGGCKNLREEVQREKAWATPRVQMSERCSEITKENRERLATRNKSNLEEEIAGHCKTATGKLNPRWVETLMGLPVGWTMPSCQSPVTIAPTNSDYSETEL